VFTGAFRPYLRLTRQLLSILNRRFLEHWFNLSDPRVEGNALPFAGVRYFVGIDIGHEAGAG
jgi:hypothetical protein